MTQIFIKKSYTYSHIQNYLIPILCTFIVTEAPTILLLLVGLFVVYIFAEPPKSSTTTASLPTALDYDNKHMDDAVSQQMESKDDTTASATTSHPQDVKSHKSTNMSTKDRETKTKSVSKRLTVEKEEEIEETPSKRHSTPFLNDNILSNSSIEFENLMQFPPCPTTLPRLDTHFNFVIDHDFKSPDTSKIDWSAIHQEMEYDRQRLNADGHHSNIGDSTMNITTDKQLQQSLLLHQLQQDNIYILFSDEEEGGEFSTTSSSAFSTEYKMNDNENCAVEELKAATTMTQQRRKEKTDVVHYDGVTIPTPFHGMATTITTNDAAILVVKNEDFNIGKSSSSSSIKNRLLLHDETLSSISIEDLLLLPPAPKPSLSSPGQLFKSKFQKAVRKMRKSSSNFSDTAYERLSIYSDVSSSKKASSLHLNSYFSSHNNLQQDPLFSADAGALSPRPSASARVQGHFKGRLNKLFRR